MGDELRVRGREGEEVRFSRAAARRAGTLSDWLEDTGGDGAFSALPVSTAALRVIATILEEEEEAEEEQEGAGTGGRGAIAAVALASRELDRRLEGKGVGELREALGAAADLSEAEAAAALAEPAFVPPGIAPASADDGPPAPQRSLSSSLSEDALGEALSEVGAATLFKLKGVSAAWRARARGELCARLCGRGGQRAPQPPARLDGITDLDVEGLRRVGRPGDAATAGRHLPSLARLHGWGFAVDVAAVRAQDLSVDGPMLGQNLRLRPSFPRLRGCVAGEGEAPLELLLAAAACAASTDLCGVPVEALRGDASPTELDFCNKRTDRCLKYRPMPQGGHLGAVGARLLALLVSGNCVLTTLNLCNNRSAHPPQERSRLR